MFETLKSRIYQGDQAIPDIKKAVINKQFRGLPLINQQNCTNCSHCISICPTNAISEDNSIDLGKCIFCGDCERECLNKAIQFTNFHKISSTSREYLIVDPETTLNDYEANAIKSSEQIKKLFGKSLKLRQVSAGGCNGCEQELNACSNVNFDMGRFGIDIVASPRHADGIIITGPITENMRRALEDAYLSTPDPKIIILAGTCAISGGIFQDSEVLKRDFLEKHKIDLYIPGCPVHPLTVINGILGFLEN
ncbi:MAG: NADH ubiquinone oxidoreductase, 20 kDa subunit [uncultured bacterium]|nr:MAG: NADH ubiquinone oxidoreductase, 20 kDa subunit [uncultured bacterium]HBH19009.1 NADH:ubiquinone oxidoreductase [Cyanobacteria bacterium UBA9579]